MIRKGDYNTVLGSPEEGEVPSGRTSDLDDVQVVEMCRIGLWSMAAGIAAVFVACLAFLLFEVPVLYRIAQDLLLLSGGLLCVAPICLAVRSWIRHPQTRSSMLGDLLGSILVEAAGLGLLYCIYTLYTHGKLAHACVGVLAVVASLVLLAWLCRRRIRLRLRQQRAPLSAPPCHASEKEASQP
jgi:hypothetical protein